MTTSYKFYYENILKEDLLIKVHENKKLNFKTISMNIGLNNAIRNKKELLMAITALELITGVYPNATYSKNAIANFNLKKDIAIGSTVKLYNNFIYYFAEKLKMLTLPAIKELNLMKKTNFDNYGNYSIGIKDLTVLTEISPQYEKFQNLTGMDLIFTSFIKKNSKTKLLLTNIQLPFITMKK